MKGDGVHRRRADKDGEDADANGRKEKEAGQVIARLQQHLHGGDGSNEAVHEQHRDPDRLR